MRRLSFRALDVEQIGHVYEGLLDHRAARGGRPRLHVLDNVDPDQINLMRTLGASPVKLATSLAEAGPKPAR
jgi:hypothetical protein